MRLYFASWIMIVGFMTALTGCGWKETSNNKSTIIGNTIDARMQPDPAIAVRMNGLGKLDDYSPKDVVKSTIADLHAILGNEALQQPARSGERRRLIEELIRHRVSYEGVAERALGAQWKRLNATEQQEFVSLFVQLLRDTLASKIDQYYDEQIVYLSVRRSGHFAEVRTNLVGSKVDTSLDFQLGGQSGHWLIYDMVIDDASMVRNYQAQFNRIIRDDSYEGLVKKLRQKSVTIKVFERTAPDVALSSMHTSPQ
jgi:phospholipid transport system substrate-binding protein